MRNALAVLLVAALFAPFAAAQTVDDLDRALTARRNDLHRGPSSLATPCPATPIQPPVTINGSITTSSCTDQIGLREDVYSVYVAAGQTIDIEMYSTAFEVFLYADLGDFNSIPTDRVDYLSIDGISRVRARYTFAESGTLLIEAESLYSREQDKPWQGPYTLKVALTGGPPADPFTRTQIVPIVGHVTGAGGSEFRSDLKLWNSSGSTITGRLVFTPRGQSGSAADPFVSFSVPAGAVKFYQDVYLLAYPGQNGAARITIVPDNNAAGLMADTSTYTALPGGGELGQAPTIFRANEYYQIGAHLAAIVGKKGERSNLVIMTGPGTDPVEIGWRYRHANGAAGDIFTKTYAPNATHQLSVSDLLLGAPSENGVLEAFIRWGSARVAINPVNNVSNQGRWTDFRPVQ